MKKILGGLILIFSMMTYANDEMSLNVKADAPNFVVTLPANPTTGFQWSVEKFDKNLLILSDTNFERPKNNLIGAGGQMHFTFTVQKKKMYPESTEIILKYARGWEPGSGSVKKIKVHFTR